MRDLYASGKSLGFVVSLFNKISVYFRDVDIRNVCIDANAASYEDQQKGGGISENFIMLCCT